MFRFTERLENRQFLSAVPTIAVGEPDPTGGADDGGVIVEPVDVPVVITAAPVTTSIGTGLPVQAEAGRHFFATIAKLPKGTATNTSQLSATIDWGDGSGSSLAGFYRGKNGQIFVRGEHTYADAGSYNVTVTVARRPYVPPGQVNPFFAIRLGTISTTATVASQQIGQGTTLTEVATRSFTAKLGTFQFRPLDIILDGAQIDWGDGKKSAGSIQHTGGFTNLNYDVFGTHTYAQTGTYKVHVVVKSHLAGSNLPSGTMADFFATIKVMGNA